MKSGSSWLLCDDLETPQIKPRESPSNLGYLFVYEKQDLPIEINGSVGPKTVLETESTPLRREFVDLNQANQPEVVRRLSYSAVDKNLNESLVS